jgi:tripeptide aminopeptidase
MAGFPKESGEMARFCEQVRIKMRFPKTLPSPILMGEGSGVRAKGIAPGLKDGSEKFCNRRFEFLFSSQHTRSLRQIDVLRAKEYKTRMNGFAIDRQRLLERFLRYVQIGSAADPQSDTYPSSSGQLVMGKLLADELKAMGIADACQDQHGLVWGSLPSNIPGEPPTILFNSHVDTSPEAPAENVSPRVIDRYEGGSIPLEHNKKVITVEHCPGLGELVGKTLVVTDGRTLLGADDKAGLAVILELVQTLIEHPELPHGKIEILFTCDEEIGAGTAKFDRSRLDAVVAYTLDGGGIGEIDEETFSADLATVHFVGKNIHPSIGKGRMVNAVRAAGIFLSKMPSDHLSPESTDGRDGFLHPYDLQAGVGEAVLQILLRDFDSEKLVEYRELLEEIATDVELDMPEIQVVVETKPQYRNMAEGLRKLPQAVDLAVKAYEKLGIVPRRTIVRGGTDGSQLTAMGLPTPNLSVGQYNIHSLLEFACLDHMVTAVQHLVELVRLWSGTSLGEGPSPS